MEILVFQVENEMTDEDKKGSRLGQQDTTCGLGSQLQANIVFCKAKAG